MRTVFRLETFFVELYSTDCTISIQRATYEAMSHGNRKTAVIAGIRVSRNALHTAGRLCVSSGETLSYSLILSCGFFKRHDLLNPAESDSLVDVKMRYFIILYDSPIYGVPFIGNKLSLSICQNFKVEYLFNFNFMTKHQIERVSFCKYLLTQAKVHAQKDKPLSSLAILILHDLVEIYLHVACEIYSPSYKKPHIDILQSLTTEINKKLQEKHESPHINQSFIKRLNERRNPLKHASIFVDKDSISDLYRETETFLNDFTPILFDISIDDISLVDLVKNEKIRAHLKDAEKYLAESNYNYAIVSVTKAYHYLQHESLRIELGRGAHIPIGKIGQWSYAQAYANRLRSMSGKPLDNAVNDIVLKIGKDINKLSEKIADLEIVATCGGDYKSFLTFRLQLPHIYTPSTADTDDTLKFWNDSPQEIAKFSYEAEDVRYCLGFLIDVVFRIQGAHTA